MTTISPISQVTQSFCEVITIPIDAVLHPTFCSWHARKICLYSMLTIQPATFLLDLSSCLVAIVESSVKAVFQGLRAIALRPGACIHLGKQIKLTAEFICAGLLSLVKYLYDLLRLLGGVCIHPRLALTPTPVTNSPPDPLQEPDLKARHTSVPPFSRSMPSLNCH